MPETGPGESYERNSPGRESKLSPILRSFLLVGIFLALLFIPAGRLDWWEGWAFVFAFITSVSVMVVWVNRRDPDLIKERRQPGENVKRWDRIIMGIYTILLLVMLVLASLDSGRFEWSNPPGPMYDGVILSMLCVPLVLGSLWALIPALLIVILFIVRTALEDRTLMEELPGYEEYAQQVRYRLVPLLW
jgi:protein-S-isoprenylcysteine O-methyltransferase Ste14